MGSTASGDDVFAWLNRSRLGDGIKHDDWAGSVVRGNRGPSEDHEDHESTVTKVGAEVGYAMSRSLHVDSPMTQTVRSRHCLDNCLGVTTPPGGAPGVGADVSGRWISEAIEPLDRLRETQAAALDEAVAVCADAIGDNALVHCSAPGTAGSRSRRCFPARARTRDSNRSSSCRPRFTPRSSGPTASGKRCSSSVSNDSPRCSWPTSTSSCPT